MSVRIQVTPPAVCTAQWAPAGAAGEGRGC